ncbi:MAG: ferritin family protein [Phycisphaerae bacterium]|nr:ferritin family protein [Phycisphaerae bacterium]
MEKKFSVFEILEVAEKIEHNAAGFYLKASELYDDSQLRDIYHKLANWRAKHEKILTQRRKEYSEKTGALGIFDPNDYVLSNPEVMAGLTWLGSKSEPAKALTGQETKKEVLHDAVKRAEEAIAFYEGLKDFARDPEGERAIDKIIEDEKQNIRLLMEQLEQK